MSRKQVNVNYREVTPQIAAALSALTGETWQAAGHIEDQYGAGLQTQGNHDHQALLRTDGMALWLHQVWNSKDRLTISYSMDEEERKQYSSYSDHCPSITVAADKPADQIAKDITRRLLADAVALRVKLRGKVDAHNDYLVHQEANRQAINQAMGDQADLREWASKAPGKAAVCWSVINAEFDCSGNDVTLKAHSLPVEVAAQIAGLIAEYNRTHQRQR